MKEEPMTEHIEYRVSGKANDGGTLQNEGTDLVALTGNLVESGYAITKVERRRVTDWVDQAEEVERLLRESDELGKRSKDRIARLKGSPTKEERSDFALAHAQGLHDDVPREFCPDCEAQGRRA